MANDISNPVAEAAAAAFNQTVDTLVMGKLMAQGMLSGLASTVTLSGQDFGGVQAGAGVAQKTEITR